MLFSGLILFLYVVLRKRRVATMLFGSRRDCLATALFGLALFGSQVTFALSIQATNAGTACILQMLNSAFVLGYTCFTARRAPKIREGAGLALALAATAIIASQGSLESISLPADGLLYGLLNALTVAIYVIIPRKSGLFDRYGALATTGMGMLAGALPAVFSHLLAIADGSSPLISATPFSFEAWVVMVVGVTALGTCLSFALFLTGIKRLGGVLGSLTGAVEPVSASIISAVWLHTAFTVADGTGLALMLCMLLCITASDKKPAIPRKNKERNRPMETNAMRFTSAQVESPIGSLTICSNGAGLCGLWMEGQKYFGGTIPKEMIPVAVEDDPVLMTTAEWLKAYFGGDKPDLSDLPLAPIGSEFRQTVWSILEEIPYGEVMTYGEIAHEAARRLGKEKMASLAVGGAVGHNPISIIIPCHRVVGTNRSLTGYAGGLDKKLWLLDHEEVDTSNLIRPTKGTAL